MLKIQDGVAILMKKSIRGFECMITRNRCIYDRWTPYALFNVISLYFLSKNFFFQFELCYMENKERENESIG